MPQKLPKTRASTSKDYVDFLYKSFNVKHLDREGVAKKGVPYLTASQTRKMHNAWLSAQAKKYLEKAESTNLRNPHFPKINKDRKGINQIRVGTAKGHRSAVSMKYSDIPKPLVLTRSLVGGAQNYWRFILEVRGLLDASKPAQFIRLDLQKAYLNITASMLLRAQRFLAHKAGMDVNGRRFSKEHQAFEQFLFEYRSELFIQPELQQGLFLGAGASHHLANLLYQAVALSLDDAAVVFQFEDDLLLIHRQDARVDLNQHYRRHALVLDRWGLAISPEKVQSGTLGKEGLTFLGYHYENQALHIQTKKLGHRLSRMASFIRAFVSRHQSLPAFKLMQKKNTQFMSYYGLVGNKADVKEYLDAQALRMLRIAHSERNKIPFIASTAMIRAS
ncbi:MAG: hypothetical protein IBX50_05965 [Marinospirillum sp.]|uniref:reverse transcriptase domain-containing protein n=1 Tax=Marinospirillum sp. TaxID=2183934 RepID=UPI0019E3190C|nr:reverse transcriptase domain-containing protein [Marinospirillum sp.]MBE0506252.1 hypothetical protein [Marinospirillum sp.]